MPLEQTIAVLSQRLLHLDTGALAQLRRMEVGGVGPMPYWALAAECGFLDADATAWMSIVHILAILTPKGERDYDKRPHEAKQTPGEVREQHGRDRLHDPKRSLGEALCDGGDPNWTLAGAARPVLSEARLARLLATPAEQRGEALTRLARMLATRRDRASGVNCVEIAALLLSHDAKSNLQQIARAYYRRLDSALRNAEQEKVQP